MITWSTSDTFMPHLPASGNLCLWIGLDNATDAGLMIRGARERGRECEWGS